MGAGSAEPARRPPTPPARPSCDAVSSARRQHLQDQTALPRAVEFGHQDALPLPHRKRAFGPLVLVEADVKTRSGIPAALTAFIRTIPHRAQLLRS